jgi:hypothetical protein
VSSLDSTKAPRIEKIWAVIFWHVTLCSFVEMFRRFIQTSASPQELRVQECRCIFTMCGRGFLYYAR